MSSGWELDLPDGWSYKRLTDLVTDVVDNRGRSAPTAPTGIPLIATNCITGDGLYPVFKNVRYVSEETFRTWFRAHPRHGDIIFVNKGTPGLVCQVPDPVNFCFAQDMVALRPDTRVVDAEFLFAALRSEYVAEQVKAFSVGTTIPHLKKSDFPKLLIPLPPPDLQAYIGRLYCNLSRKIEVNRRINRTLERMAQALYRHWFVDFGPFQDGEFAESEVGLVPRGWEAVRLGDVIEVFDRLRVPLSSMERAKRPGPYRYFGATGVVDYIDDYIFDGTYVLTGEDGSVITDRDTPVVQYVFGQFWVNNHAHVLRGRNGVSTEHVKVFLDQTNVRSFVTGAVQPKISQANLRSIPYLSAPPEVNVRFDAYLQPWFAKIRAIEVENEKLAATRDYLLPRLLAGEVEVSYAT